MAKINPFKASTKINPFKASTLEMIANAIADIDPGITGSVIHRMLLQSQIEDISYNEQFLAKRKKTIQRIC